MDRPVWNKLDARLKAGDTVVFDSVSRMSRSAEEGFQAYKNLYERGVELVFLNEHYIDTAAYRKALRGIVSVDIATGDKDANVLIGSILRAINEFMLSKVKDDVFQAFAQSEKEVVDLRKRISQGIREVQRNNEILLTKYGDDAKQMKEFKQVGRETGDKLNVKKSEPIKALIRKYSRDFEGSLSDKDLLSILAGRTVKIEIAKGSGKLEAIEVSAKLARNTLYKYKREIKEELLFS